MSRPFADMAMQYLPTKLGGPVPLPERGKYPPETGWTGWAAPYPSGADVVAWAEDKPRANIGLRLADGVLGLDVDAYAGKNGHRTLRRLQEALGHLPPTVRSTSRGDGVSGIRLYRVPAGLAWAGEVEAAHEDGEVTKGIEVIHLGHRYVVCAPSVHNETGNTYRWLNEDGTELGRLPIIDDLPELPAAWVEYLASGTAEDAARAADLSDEQTSEWLEHLDDGDACAYVRKLRQKVAEAVAGDSRHDSVRGEMLRMLRAGEQGHRGAASALTVARAAFISAVSDPGSPSRRTSRAAAAEWERMLTGGVKKIAASPSQKSSPGCRCADSWPDLVDVHTGEILSQALEPSGPEASTLGAPPFEVRHVPEHLSWAPVDLTDVLDGTYVEAEPTLFPRVDGRALFYAGLTHSLHGESESGKSLVMQVEAVRQVNRGQDVLYIDFESDRQAVTKRLLMFGASSEAIRRHFTYIRPEVQPSSSEAEAGAWRAMLGRPYALAVIDGVTDCLGVFGYSTKDNDDIVAWHRNVPRAIADGSGAAVVLIDHVTKDKDTRGRMAIGGQAKMAALTGAAYTVDIAQPLGKGLRGVVVLRVAKDRPGGIRAHCGPMRSDRTQEAARVVVDSRGAAPVVTVEAPGVGNPTSGAGPASFRPTALMELVSDVLLVEPGLTKNKIVDRLEKNRKATLQAVDLLVAEGYAEVKPGPGTSQLHTAVRPYRQVEDPRSDRYEGAGTTLPPERVVPGSSPYTGGLGTSPNRFPGTTSEPGGTTDLVVCEECQQPRAHAATSRDGGSLCATCRDLRRAARVAS